VALIGATLEASLAGILGRDADRAAALPVGTNHHWYIAPYDWINHCLESMVAGAFTVLHSGGENWSPIVAAAAIALLITAAALTQGWKQGRFFGTLCMCSGVIIGGITTIPIAVSVAVAIFAGLGYVLWSIALVVLMVAIVVAAALFIGFLLWVFLAGQG